MNKRALIRSLSQAATFMWMLPSCAPAQIVATSHESIIQMQARAHLIRSKVVHLFGSPIQAMEFDKPHQETRIKPPKIHEPVTREHIRALADWGATREEPDEIFDTVFGSLLSKQLYELLPAGTTTYKQRVSLLSRALERFTPLIPFGGEVMAEKLEDHKRALAKSASKEAEAKALEAYLEARQHGIIALIAQLLSPEDAKRFESLDESGKAALIFQAALQV